MSTIIVEVYEALKEAGASEEKAKSAAETLANYEGKFSKIETDLTVIKWMLGVLIAMSASLIIRLFL